MLGARWGGVRERRGTWLLVLFFLLGVLAPTGAIVWLMREATRSQVDAARQHAAEAYLGQLHLLRQHVDDWMRSRSTGLGNKAGTAGAAEFLSVLRTGGVDSVVLLDSHGHASYPSLPAAPPMGATASGAAWIAARALEDQNSFGYAAIEFSRLAESAPSPSLYARALQSEIRCEVRGGRKEEAVATILKGFSDVRAAKGTDLQGRLILADEQLFAVQLMRRSDRRFLPVADRLAKLLNDYEAVSMPSSQRLFLMEELKALVPDRVVFPSLAAEKLAAQYLEANNGKGSDATLEATGVRDLWRITSSDGRVVALYRTNTLIDSINRLLQEKSSSSGARFSVAPPGVPPSGEAIAAGPALPGWQIAFSYADTKAMEQATSSRLAIYLWVGYLVIAALAFTGILLGYSFRRQYRLTQLKTDLVATVSHEMRTPLASMRLLIESLQDDRNPDQLKTHEYLELIAGGNRRLSRLVENFLAFSRIERNREPFKLSPTSPGSVIESVQRAVGERLQSPGCRIEVEIDPDLPNVLADADALETAVLNLVDNAIKYTSVDKRIALRAHAEENCVVFSVVDNGIGIAPREQKRIFRSFYRVDRRLARETSGCGLGLSIVASIVRAHGGLVQVTSQLGSGSTFRILLPSVRSRRNHACERRTHSDH